MTFQKINVFFFKKHQNLAVAFAYARLKENFQHRITWLRYYQIYQKVLIASIMNI